MVTAARKTAIATPRTLDLKQLQTLADSVRQRISEVEADAALLAQRSTGGGASAASLDTINRQLATLAQNLAALTLVVDGITEGATTTTTITYSTLAFDADEPEPAFF